MSRSFGPITSLGGYEFHKEDLRWQLDRKTVIIFDELSARLNVRVFKAYINTLAVYGAENAATTVMNIHSVFTKLARFSKHFPLSCEALLEARASGEFPDSSLSSLRGFLKKWLSLKGDGVTRELVTMMDRWRLESSTKGDAVKLLDPHQGPYTDLEFCGTVEALAFQYESGDISISQFSFSLLLLSTGRRPLQLLRLRLRDLRTRRSKNGFVRCFLNIPRTKQRGSRFREFFREVEVVKDLWDVLQVLKEFVLESFKYQLGSDIPPELSGELPLFFAYSQLIRIENADQLSSRLITDVLHMTTGEMKGKLRQTFRRTRVISERTGEQVVYMPRRFRYTFGTRAAREGYGIETIAYLLDHSDTTNVDVYTQNIPEHGAHIDSVVGKYLEPIGQAFLGQVVEDKLYAGRGNVPGSDIRLTSGEPGGTCGHAGVCGANVPSPCYTCPYFQPWLNAPHEKFQKELISQRSEILARTNDQAIASILDRTIIAVGEVVKICERRRKGS